jgi:hypothetical protein
MADSIPAAEALTAATTSTSARTWADWLISHLNTADIVLVVLLLAACWVVWKAQQRTDFDFADMLKDDTTGKPTALRMAILGSFAISSWVVMHDTLGNNLSDQQFWAYLVTWSGAAILRYVAERWNGQLPWSRPDEHRP